MTNLPGTLRGSCHPKKDGQEPPVCHPSIQHHSNSSAEMDMDLDSYLESNIILDPGTQKLIEEVCISDPDVTDDIFDSIANEPDSFTKDCGISSPCFNNSDPSLENDDSRIIINTLDHDIVSNKGKSAFPTALSNSPLYDEPLNTPEFKSEESYDLCLEDDQSDMMNYAIAELHKELIGGNDDNILVEALKESGLEFSEIPNDIDPKMIDSLFNDSETEMIDEPQTDAKFLTESIRNEQTNAISTCVPPVLTEKLFVPLQTKAPALNTDNEEFLKTIIIPQQGANHVKPQGSNFVNQNVPGYLNQTSSATPRSVIKVHRVTVPVAKSRPTITIDAQAICENPIPSTSYCDGSIRGKAQFKSKNTAAAQDEGGADNDAEMQPPKPKRSKYSLSGLTPEEKYKRTRQQNNEASKKSRQKRKDRQIQKLEEVQALEEKNRTLKLEYERLSAIRVQYDRLFEKYTGRKPKLVVSYALA